MYHLFSPFFLIRTEYFLNVPSFTNSEIVTVRPPLFSPSSVTVSFVLFSLIVFILSILWAWFVLVSTNSLPVIFSSSKRFFKTLSTSKFDDLEMCIRVTCAFKEEIFLNTHGQWAHLNNWSTWSLRTVCVFWMCTCRLPLRIFQYINCDN